MPDLACSVRGSFSVFVFIFVGFCISYGTPYWYSSTGRHEGLWQTCTSTCTRIHGELSDPLLKGVQALMTISLFFHLLTLIIYCIWLRRGKSFMKENGLTALGKITLAASVFAAVTCDIAVIVYGIDHLDLPVLYLGWSYFLAVACGGLGTINSLITSCAISRKYGRMTVNKPQDIEAHEPQQENTV